MSIKVLPYSSDFFDHLIEYNKKKYPSRKKIEEVLNFIIFKNPFSEKNRSFYIALDENKIIGQYLLIPSKYWYKNNCDKIYWGFNFYTDEEYRSSGIGLLLAQETLSEHNHIGIGSTNTAKKLHLNLGEKSIGWISQFIYFRNFIAPFSLLLRRRFDITFIKEKHPVFPKNIFIGNICFKLSDNVPEGLPEFWNNDLFEMTRSKEFLKWRFFSNLIQYYFYQFENNNGPPIYFVVRHAYHNSVNILFLVDYRISANSDRDFILIIRALKKLVKKTKLDAILCTSSLQKVDLILKRNRFINLKRKSTEILTNVIKTIEEEKITERTFTLITPADSDFDLFF